ncbi:hypothetical protein ACFOY4_16990 [Actinomadura syzygii]|uniref:Uncharacterized protein n=1 Tax=Actinomadura syzygii TaxID=1427538 RepID=A0A5D0TZY3_9ACTN|nr:hypothetical protein [Actinomadura syzygii]TYC10902.1 hypothetical protein FXF65_28395 [Actinomadura syzygii]
MGAQMGGGQMRTGPGARDPQFRGIDPPALDQVIRQLQDAQNAIQGWLNGHRPPPGVPTAGYRQADEVARWAAEQLEMLTRRYNYAVTHPSPGGEVDAPPAPTPAPTPGTRTPQPAKPPKSVQPPRGPSQHAPTPRGAGDIGNFPDRKAATKAARTDALAVVASIRDGRPVPDPVWRHLKANADDPDYTGALYERLGPAGAAALLKAAHGDEAKVRAVQEALGVSSHHMTMDARWLRAFLAEADRAGVRPVAVQVLAGADLSPRAREALARIGPRPHAADVA